MVASWLVAAAVLGAEPPVEDPGRTLVLLSTWKQDGWVALRALAFKDSGQVQAKAGRLRLAKGDPATGIHWPQLPDFPRDNYELTMSARRLAGGDFFCGLTFPVGPEYCTLILGGWGGFVTGLSNINDDPAVENETANYFEFERERWYAIRLRVTTRTIEAWVDGQRIVAQDRRDKRFTIWWEQEPARPLGIATWHTAGEFRQIRLRRLPVRDGGRPLP